MPNYFSKSFSLNSSSLELSDYLLQMDLDTLERKNVFQEALMQMFHEVSDFWAVDILKRIPTQNGVLDAQWVDELFLRTHVQFQQLLRVFRHGPRFLKVLQPLLKRIAQRNPRRLWRGKLANRDITSMPFEDSPRLAAGSFNHVDRRSIQIVDLGCGLGYIPRWFNRYKKLKQDVRWIGVDLNPVLIEKAKQLAEQQNAHCEFFCGNAFSLDLQADVYTSTGLLHHLQGVDLECFFSKLEHSTALGFIHFDFQPIRSIFYGSLFLHWIKMREEFARHDGLVSVLRAHSKDKLLKVAKEFAPSFQITFEETSLGIIPIPRAFHAFCGVRKL